MTPTNDSWNAWGKHVLSELERFNIKLESMDCACTDIKVEIGKLKIKSGIWGLIGGSIPVAISMALYFFSLLIP